MSCTTLQEQIDDKALTLAQGKLLKSRLAYRSRCMSLPSVLKLRREVEELVPNVTDPMYWLYPDQYGSSQHLKNSLLKEALQDVELGGWALSADSINYLADFIRKDRPCNIIEFGSGASTLVLLLLSAGCSVRIVSVEQDAKFAKKTLDLLKKFNLDSYAEIIVSPLREQMRHGKQIQQHDFDDIAPQLVDFKADLVLIDGPCAPPGSRVHVMEELLERNLVADKARFLMDDALRDGELWAACCWHSLPEVAVNGIRWVGKGFLDGTVALPAS